jgi:hypothetical protein
VYRVGRPGCVLTTFSNIVYIVVAISCITGEKGVAIGRDTSALASLLAY